MCSQCVTSVRTPERASDYLATIKRCTRKPRQKEPNMKRSALSILCTASLALTAAFALEGRCQAAARDLSFGNNGVVAVSGGGSGWAATAQQADGKLLHCADAGAGIKLSRMHLDG